MKSNQAAFKPSAVTMRVERPYSYRILRQEMLSELDRLVASFSDSVPHREVTRWLYDSTYNDLCRHCRALAAQELESKLEARGRQVVLPQASPLLRPRIADEDDECTCCWLSVEDKESE
jgi:hypothetical protein